MEWYRYNEEKPEEDEVYLITWTADAEYGGKHKRTRRFIHLVEWYEDEWILTPIEKMGYKNIEVIAWAEVTPFMD